MEFWSTGVLRPVGIAPRFRGVGGAFRAVQLLALPGLKPWAMVLCRFAATTWTLLTRNFRRCYANLGISAAPYESS
jgi:hypothetical protein